MVTRQDMEKALATYYKKQKKQGYINRKTMKQRIKHLPSIPEKKLEHYYRWIRYGIRDNTDVKEEQDGIT